MSILSKMKLRKDVVLPTPKRGSSVRLKRTKMILSCERQIHIDWPKEKVDIGADASYAKSKIKIPTREREVKPQYFFDNSINAWTFVVLYSKKHVKFGPNDEYAIDGTKDKESIKGVILDLIQAIKDGELDAALEVAGAAPPRKTKAATSAPEPSKASKPGEKH